MNNVPAPDLCLSLADFLFISHDFRFTFFRGDNLIRNKLLKEILDFIFNVFGVERGCTIITLSTSLEF